MSSILIAENNDFFRGALGQILKCGLPDIEIMEAASGQKALELYEKYSPDILLADIHIPPPNGLEIARLIKGRDPRRPVLIMTGHAEPEYRQLAEDAGADYFFVKDKLKRAELAAWIKSVTDGQGE